MYFNVIKGILGLFKCGKKALIVINRQQFTYFLVILFIIVNYYTLNKEKSKIFSKKVTERSIFYVIICVRRLRFAKNIINDYLAHHERPKGLGGFF